MGPSMPVALLEHSRVLEHSFCRKSSPPAPRPVWLLRAVEGCAGARVGRAQGVWGWEKPPWVGTVGRWQAPPCTASRSLASQLGIRSTLLCLAFAGIFVAITVFAIWGLMV